MEIIPGRLDDWLILTFCSYLNVGRLQQHIYFINTSCHFFLKKIQNNALFVFFKSYLFDFQHGKAKVGEEEETNYKYLISITSTNSASNPFLT